MEREEAKERAPVRRAVEACGAAAMAPQWLVENLSKLYRNTFTFLLVSVFRPLLYLRDKTAYRRR